MLELRLQTPPIPQSSIANLQYTEIASLPARRYCPACPGVEVPAHVPSIAVCPLPRCCSGLVPLRRKPRRRLRTCRFSRAAPRSRAGPSASRPSQTLPWSSAINSSPIDGRAEVLLGDGSALHLDERTTVDFNGDTVLRLVSGRLIVLAERGAAGTLQIDAAPASVRVQSSAEVHLALLDDRGQPTLQVAVVRGLVDVDSGNGPVAVQSRPAGLRARGRGAGLPGALQLGAARRLRPLVAGAARRPSRHDVCAVPACRRARLRLDVRPGTDRGATTRRTAMSGIRAWPRRGGRTTTDAGVTRAATAGTFIGYDPWGWATHHYGRWGLSSAGAWFWIPSAGWGAAWVNWAVAPGYVGWCPLGWNNRPVVGFWGHGYRSTYYGGHGHYDPWRAWSVVPTHSFRRGSAIHREPFDRRGFTRPASTQLCRAADAAVGGDSARLVGRARLPRGRPVGGAARRPVAARSAAGGLGHAISRSASQQTAGAIARSPAPAASSRTLSSGSATGAPAVAWRPTCGDLSPRHAHRAAVRLVRGQRVRTGRRGGAAGPSGRTRRGARACRLRSTCAIRKPRGLALRRFDLAYSRGRSSDASDPAATPSRPSDHPDYAVPRGGDRPSPPQYRAPEQPQHRAPESPRYQPSDRGRGSQGESPRATPRSAPSPRAEGPSSRAHGGSAGPRSGSSGGSSSGTAVPRRR